MALMTLDDYYTDSIVIPGRYFRLRVGHRIVGYMLQRDNGQTLYSVDNYSWRSVPIEHEHTDRSSGLFDRNRVMIFEHDVVKLKKTDDMAYTPRGWVVWDDLDNKMFLNILEARQMEEFPPAPSEAPFRDDLTVISQLYAPEDEG